LRTIVRNDCIVDFVSLETTLPAGITIIVQQNKIVFFPNVTHFFIKEKKRMPNAWLSYLKEYKKKNPKLSYKECMKKASVLWKKKKSSKK